MGYSARYHAASLIAVFLSLAIGILVGAEFGGEVVSNTRESLEESLAGNLEESRAEVDELSGELARTEEYIDRIYPQLVGEKFSGERIGVVALGGLPAGTLDHIDHALEPTGAEITALGVVRIPPRVDAMASIMESARPGFGDVDDESVRQVAFGFGQRLPRVDPVRSRLRGEIFSRVSGDFSDTDRVIITRVPAVDLEADADEMADAFEQGLVSGLIDSGISVVGVETSDQDESSIRFFDSLGAATVDNLDEYPGRLALVLALIGAQGNFGSKETADGLLPDVITGLGVSPSTEGASPGEAVGE